MTSSAADGNIDEEISVAGNSDLSDLGRTINRPSDQHEGKPLNAFLSTDVKINVLSTESYNDQSIRLFVDVYLGCVMKKNSRRNSVSPRYCLPVCRFIRLLLNVSRLMKISLVALSEGKSSPASKKCFRLDLWVSENNDRSIQ